MSCINTCYIGHVPHMTFIDNFVNIFWTIADMYLVRYLTLIVAGISWYCMQIRYLAFLCMLLFFLAEIFVANWILLSLVRPLWFWNLQILCISCMIPIAHGFCRKPWRIDLAGLTFWLVCIISLLVVFITRAVLLVLLCNCVPGHCLPNAARCTVHGSLTNVHRCA